MRRARSSVVKRRIRIAEARVRFPPSPLGTRRIYRDIAGSGVLPIFFPDRGGIRKSRIRDL